MSAEIRRVPLSIFEEPIRDALDGYGELVDTVYSFDKDRAAEIDFVPGKPTPRSKSPIKRGDEHIADLYVIAFAPGDATGDDKTYSLDQLRMDEFPDEAKYIPRSKAGTHSEAHITIATKNLDTADAPTLFAGYLTVLGLVGSNNDLVAEVGYVGQESHAFASSLPHGWQSGRSGRPTATLTTGFSRGLTNPAEPGERFGDPHAILNRVEYVVQVAGFIAITHEMAPKHLELLSALGAKQFQPYPY